MTMVDPVTGWFEQAQLNGSPTAHCCQQIFDNIWLACYPQGHGRPQASSTVLLLLPNFCIHIAEY